MENGVRARIKAVAARLQQAFEEAGAVVREPDSLLPAEVLLDLYGEDIRARAYVTQDPVLGELVLRPDFTMPVVQMHMAEGAVPARYTYNGSVWRKQLAGSARRPENTQVGFELFDRANPAAADAEVFALFDGLLDDWSGVADIAVATGDVGILQAAVRGLNTTERRKAALLRHLWRPARFRQLLDRFGGRAPVPEGREKLVELARKTAPETLVVEAGPLVGLRSAEEIAARIADLGQDLAEPPIAAEEYELLGKILSIKAGSVAALDSLRMIETEMPVLRAAVDRMAARLDALSAKGIAVDDLPFEGNFGLTAMEYYDGFVFGFYAEGRPDLPTLASGGRYDALTRVLGQGRSIPAVGGVFHPEALVALSGGSA
jgi:ATP phosphoribosyltransferase regulatory subunit